MRETTTWSLGLFAAWALHDAEEWVTMPATSRKVLARLPDGLPVPAELREHGLSPAHVRWSIIATGAVVLAAAFDGARTGGRSTFFRGTLLAYGMHGYSHLAGAVALRGYATGVATTPFLVLPYWWAARRVFARHGIRDDRASAITALATGPLLVGIHAGTGILRHRRAHHRAHRRAGNHVDAHRSPRS